jgi:O-antigen/teichoic acid export membrane protein
MDRVDESATKMTAIFRRLERAFRIVLEGPLFMTWFSLSVRIGKGLLILPVAATVLDPTQLALWLLLLVVIDAAQQTELGLSPTLLRATAYFMAGAKTLNADLNVPAAASSGHAPNLEALGRIVSTGEVIYYFICVLAVPLVSGIGIYASWGFLRDAGFPLNLWLSVAATVLLVVMRLQTVFWSSILQGFGRVADYNRADGSVNAIVTVLQIVALVAGFKVLGLFAVQLIGWLFLYMWTIRMCKSSLIDLGVKTKRWTIDRDIVGEIWPLTWRLGLTMLGSFLLVNGPSLFTGQLVSAEVAAGYLLCMRVLTINRSLAGAFVLAEMPRAVRMSAHRQLGALRDFAAKRIAASNGLFLLGFLVFFVAGNPLLALLGAKARFLDPLPFFLLGVSSFLNCHMGDHLQIFVTSNRVPFWRLFSVVGVLTIALTAVLVPRYGLGALIGVRLAITVVTVAWYPVLLNLRHLNWRWRDYSRDVPLAGWHLVRSMLGRFL